jgi:hypothetical protein
VVDRQLLHRRWVHSHEEDTDRGMVFRPAGFDFPRSRGRLSFELRPDGTLVERGPGPTDAPVQVEGTWELEPGDRLILHRPGQEEPRRELTVSSVDGDRLVVQA